MTRTEAEAEMVQGFMDGYDVDCPVPSLNRSYSYRHGFLNGRDDKVLKRPRDTAERLREIAEDCIALDCGEVVLAQMA
jgi:hypothetical protein